MVQSNFCKQSSSLFPSNDHHHCSIDIPTESPIAIQVCNINNNNSISSSFSAMIVCVPFIIFFSHCMATFIHSISRALAMLAQQQHSAYYE